LLVDHPLFDPLALQDLGGVGFQNILRDVGRLSVSNVEILSVLRQLDERVETAVVLSLGVERVVILVAQHSVLHQVLLHVQDLFDVLLALVDQAAPGAVLLPVFVNRILASLERHFRGHNLLLPKLGHWRRVDRLRDCFYRLWLVGSARWQLLAIYKALNDVVTEPRLYFTLQLEIATVLRLFIVVLLRVIRFTGILFIVV